MSAEEETYRLNLEVSELDSKDGVRVNKDYRHTSFKFDTDKNDISGVNFETLYGTVSAVDNLFDYSKDSKVGKASVTDRWGGATWIATSGNMYIAEGEGNTFLYQNHLFTKYNNVTITVSFELDSVGADNYGSDDVDDRNQVTYPIKYETYPGSGLFRTLDETYTVNKGDDIVKLVTEGKYTELPLFDEVDYDKDDNEYVYQYEIKSDVIVAKWVKAGSPRFVNQVKEEVEYDELDANKDGVVSCEEALGKGWVWNNETSACELKGSSNTGSYVPNTATK